MSDKKSKRLTGKQASFVSYYLGEARFNATMAAEKAGYAATSKHSFEAIGSENLAKPAIRKAIDDHFRMSRMTADELLDELSSLARGNSKDKIRAIALLCQHHGILDGSGLSPDERGEVGYRHGIVRVPPKAAKEEWTETVKAAIYAEVDSQVTSYNEQVAKHNERIENAWASIAERYKDSLEAGAALRELYNVVHGKTIGGLPGKMPDDRQGPEATQPIEPEILPPARRLQPAKIERLMRDVPDQTPQEVDYDNGEYFKSTAYGETLYIKKKIIRDGQEVADGRKFIY